MALGKDISVFQVLVFRTACYDRDKQEELMLRASARTHLRTGVPITTHTPPESRIGEEQVRILKEEGVEPHHVYVGHINHTLAPDYHRELARLGVWLGWDVNDPFGCPELPP